VSITVCNHKSVHDRHRTRRRSGIRWRIVAGCLVAALLVVAAIGVWLVRSSGTRHPAVVSHPGLPRAVALTSLIATPKAPTLGFASPYAASPFEIVPSSWENQPSALPVVGTFPGWLEVRLLPGVSTARTAWVAASNVSISETPYRVVVDLSSARLLVFRRAHLILCAPAGIGTATDPTPAGHFFVTLFAQPPNPGYGPFVVLTSATAVSVSDWEQSGAPLVTIEGSLGSADPIRQGDARITTGAIRLLDSDLGRLRPVPTGTPVDVVAQPTRVLETEERSCVAARR